MNRSLKIFVVENHADTLTYLCRYLEQQGHAVRSARDMQSALRVFPEEPVDVLISDIGLPDGDGWELLRNLEPKPFAIAISGFGTGTDLRKSQAAGYREHLIKPFLTEDLDAVLEAAVRHLGGSLSF